MPFKEILQNLCKLDLFLKYGKNNTGYVNKNAKNIYIPNCWTISININSHDIKIQEYGKSDRNHANGFNEPNNHKKNEKGFVTGNNNGAIDHGHLVKD